MWLWLCFLMGIVVAGLSYWKEIKRNRFSKNTIYILALLRGISITFLSFLLIRPIVETHVQKIEKPITVVLHDNSLSIKDFLNNNPEWKEKLKQNLSDVENLSEVVYYAFDQSLTSGWDSLKANGASTNISAAIEEIGVRYAGRNLASIVLVTDGIFNEGNYPIYAAQNLQVPVHTIGVGDPNMYKDVLISDVQANKTTFLGNQFPIQVSIETRMAQNAPLEVLLKQNGQTIEKQNIQSESTRSFHTIQFNTDSKKLGIQHYTIDVTTLDGEKNTTNNHFDCFIEVLDDRQKISIVGAAPHPDIQAILQSINQSESFKAEYVPIEEWKGKSDGDGLTIFHGIPNQAQQVNPINEMIKAKKPCLFIWSQNTQMSLFNLIQSGINIQGANGNREERTSMVNDNFNYFQIPEELRSQSQQWPPLDIPFGKINTANGLSAYFTQQIGSLNTGIPLVAFQSSEAAKLGFIFGEGIWRWRMTNFIQSKNHEAFDNMMASWAQYLVDKNKENLFKINTKKNWAYNQSVVFQANLYDQSLKPLLNQSITLSLWNEKNEKQEFPFVPGNDGYQLELGQLPSGSYRYTAQANNGQQVLNANGTFIVENVQQELMNTWANHDLLKNLSKNTQGHFFNHTEINQLSKLINEQKNFVSVAFDESNREEWIDWWPILSLLLLAFSSEWIIRKWQGGY